MTEDSGAGPSPRAVQLFHALRRRKNVILSGPPGTGKTRLMNEVASWFEQAPGVGFDPTGDVPFPPSGESVWLPSPERTVRKVFRMVFHPGTRYRHLLRELEPVPGRAGEFRFSRGTLFEANEHALQENGTSLVIIDEINRGPAVEVFGDAVVAIESDKRLGHDDEPTPDSASILLPSESGQRHEYQFSSHLYIVAAMNEADASVAPIDVAFLRRWEPFRLFPEAHVAVRELNRATGDEPAELVQSLLDALVQAWERVNERISLLRGGEYQMGHAIIIPDASRKITEVSHASDFVRERWSLVEQHVREVFFGEPRREVVALSGGNDGPYRYEEAYLSTELTTSVMRPSPSTADDWLETLRAVADSED